MSTFDIPGYSIIRPIEKGGMATVYLAEQKSLEREVAIKVMAPHLSEDANFVERFELEARIASHLSHPNIVTIFDYGSITSNVNGSTLYLVMAFVDGQDLKTLQPKLSLVTRLKIIQDIANALHYAHEQGVIHRDIKPQNILVERKNSRALLTDFGVAKARQTGAQLTQTGMTLGTPHYMSPEQALGKDLDHRADIYSLGVVLFFLLTGRVPYDGDSEVAIGLKHHTDPLPRLPESFACFQRVIDRAMAKNPDDRYQNADAFAEAVGKVSIGNLATLVQSLNDESEAQTKVAIQAVSPAQVKATKKIPWLLPAGIIASVFIIGMAFFIGERFIGEQSTHNGTQEPGKMPEAAIEKIAATQTSASPPQNQKNEVENTKAPATPEAAQQRAKNQTVTADEISNDKPYTGQKPEINPQGENKGMIEGLSCSYTLKKDWGAGWEAEILLNNSSANILEGWKIDFTLPEGTQITNSYVTRKQQNGSRFTLTPHDWNKNIPAETTLKLGFQGSGRAVSVLDTLRCL